MNKLLASLILITALSGLSGCVKDKGFEDNVYGLNKPDASPVGIGFPESANKINVTAIESAATPTILKVALVNLLSDVAAEQDITVILVQDTSIAGQYNRDPASVNPVQEFVIGSEITTSLKVTIPKGQRTAFLDVTIPNSTSLDLTKTYALGLKIQSVSSGTIAANLQKVLIGVAIKNPYDGIYENRSYTLRSGDPNRTGSAAPYEIGLATSGAYSLQSDALHKWADGSGIGITFPIFTIDPATNDVTVTASGFTIGNAPGYISRYDPANKTIYAAFTWGAGPAARLALDTLKYLRPR